MACTAFDRCRESALERRARLLETIAEHIPTNGDLPVALRRRKRPSTHAHARARGHAVSQLRR